MQAPADLSLAISHSSKSPLAKIDTPGSSDRTSWDDATKSPESIRTPDNSIFPSRTNSAKFLAAAIVS